MVDKLLIRLYKVGVGDCIYVRIPKGRQQGGVIEDFHVLIDCGSKGSADQLEEALDHLKGELPVVDGKKRLDLVLVSHEHEDHMKGFDPAFFGDIKIENLWLSVAMDRTHPQAELAHQLHDLATRAMRSIEARHLALSPALQDIVNLYSINNAGAVKALTKGLPDQNGIAPRYVHSATAPGDLKPVTLTGATFKVIGPDRNIDKFYMGDEGAELLHGFSASKGLLPPEGASVVPTTAVPGNISASDFRRLQSRMLSGAFAYTGKDSELINNTSIMLLIEWRGRRLLFVGDAEWTEKFVVGQHNGAWNVAWEFHKDELGKPVDFLKIGHHGSENATPWSEAGDNAVSEPGTILNAILPLPAAGAAPTAKAVASTERSNTYRSIPRSALMREIGRRVGSVRNYASALSPEQIAELPNYEGYEQPLLDGAQPLRTDLETRLSGKGFVEVEIDPAPGN